MNDNTMLSDGFLWEAGGPETDDHLAYDPHEANLEPVMRELLADASVTGPKAFLDVGAHVGRWSLRLSNQATRVIAVEPNPDTACLLERHTTLNKLEDKITILHFAAWDEETTLRLEDPNGKQRGGSTRTLPGSGPLVVTALPLDVVLGGTPDIGLVKLDVEGADLHALRGMRETLACSRPNLFIEMHDNQGYYKAEEMYVLLHELGYVWEEGPSYREQRHIIARHI